jgi:flavin-binding protein dodecin
VEAPAEGKVATLPPGVQGLGMGRSSNLNGARAFAGCAAVAGTTACERNPTSSAVHGPENPREETTNMATLKVIELLAQSEKSWEDAAQVAVTKASKSLRGVKSVYIKEFEAQVQDGRITQYRVNAKISFELD